MLSLNKREMEIKAILFDHDGTLVDSEMAHYAMWKDILYGHNVNLSYYLSKRPFPLMPGAYESLNDFHGLGFKIGIVTSADREDVVRHREIKTEM
ncbi:MAG: HAD family hydrolase [Cyanobacteria bacterium P01_F01_bin.116]